MNRASDRSLRVPAACLGVYAAVWVALAIAPWDRAAWALENILPAVAIISLIATYRRFQFSDRAYVLGTAFMLLHCVGSHYTYSLTPIGEWMRQVFHTERNPYDRVVHFSYGVLLFASTRELYFRPPARLPRKRQLGLTVAFITAFAAVYELVEWWTAALADPQAGAAFLGTQGDEWDAQKDILCAVVGAFLGAALEWRWLHPDGTPRIAATERRG